MDIQSFEMEAMKASSCIEISSFGVGFSALKKLHETADKIELDLVIGVSSYKISTNEYHDSLVRMQRAMLSLIAELKESKHKLGSVRIRRIEKYWKVDVQQTIQSLRTSKSIRQDAATERNDNVHYLNPR